MCVHRWLIERPGIWYRTRCTRCQAIVEHAEMPEGSGRWLTDIHYDDRTVPTVEEAQGVIDSARVELKRRDLLGDV